MIKSIYVLLMAFLSSISFAATMDDARAALGKRDFAQAMPILLQLANQGDAEAQYQLGVIYGRGNAAAPEDDVEAAKWYRKAAEQGHEAAQARTALMYAYACGVARDDAEAARWFKRNADQGVPGSMFHLGRLYLAGRGVPKDVAEATRLWKRSSELGYARAQYFYALISQPDGVKKAEAAEAEINKWFDGYVNNDFAKSLAVVRPLAVKGDAWAQAFLGSMLEKGEGTARDDTEGLKWNMLAADQGYSLSQSGLATRYANGQGVPQSNVQAYKWAKLAAEQNDESAKKLEAGLVAKMTPEQLDEARKLISQWKSTH